MIAHAEKYAKKNHFNRRTHTQEHMSHMTIARTSTNHGKADKALFQLLLWPTSESQIEMWILVSAWSACEQRGTNHLRVWMISKLISTCVSLQSWTSGMAWTSHHSLIRFSLWSCQALVQIHQDTGFLELWNYERPSPSRHETVRRADAPSAWALLPYPLWKLPESTWH